MKPRKSAARHAIIVVISAFALILSACGRENKVYPDPVVSDDGNPVSTDGRTLLPKGFFNQSVNRGLVDIALEGDDSLSLRLQTNVGTNDAGGFNGAGTGNRALLGLGDYHQEKLSAIDEITFDAKTYSGTEDVDAILLVDLKCDGSPVRVLIADGAAMAPGTPVTDGYTRFTAAIDEAKWQVSGAAITDPNDVTITLVESTTSGTNSSLTALLAEYPNACVRNGASTDDEFPKNLPMAGILFGLGDSTTTSLNTVFINRITIGSDIFENLEGATP